MAATERVTFEFVGRDRVTPVARRVQASLARLGRGASGIGNAFGGLMGRMDRVGASLQNLTGGIARFGTKASIAVGVAVAAFTALGYVVGRVMRRLITEASDAAEMYSKFQVVFGQFAEGVAARLDMMARAVGRSRWELIQMAATVQDTFVPLGFARNVAAELSQAVTQLAVDVASFNNIADSEVIRDFTSALVGNHEAVRKYGVIITMARLEQELFNLGVEGGLKAATEQQKVLARLSILFNDTKDAQGDAARTANSWANVMRGLAGIFRDTRISVGMALKDALLPFAIEVRDLAYAVLPVLSTALVNALNGFRDFASNMAGQVVPAFQTVAYWVFYVAEAWRQGLGGIRDAAAAVWQDVVNLFNLAMNALNQSTARGGSGILRVLGVVLGYILFNVKAVLLTLHSLFNMFLNAMQGNWGEAWQWMKDALLTYLSATVYLLKQFWPFVAGLFKTGLKLLGDLWRAAWDWMNEKTGGALERIAGILKGAFHWIIQAFGRLWDGVLEVTRKALTWIVRGVARAVANMAESIANLLEKIPGMGAVAAKLRGVAASAMALAENAAAFINRTLDAVSWESILARFDETVGEYKARVRKLADDLGQLLDDLANRVDWGNFAPDPGPVMERWKEFIDGLDFSEKALKTQIPDLKKLMEELANSIQDAAKKARGGDRDAARQVRDLFSKIREELEKGLAYIDFQLQQGLITPLDAIKAKIQVWFQFMRAAFEAGMADAAKEAAEQIKKLKEELAKLGEGAQDDVSRAREAMQQLEESIRNAFEAARLAAGGKITAAVDVDAVRRVLESIRPQLVALFEWLNRVYDDIADLAPKAAVAGEAISKITGPVRDMLDMMDALYRANRGRLDGVLAWTRGRLREVVAWLGRVYDDIADAAPNAMAAAEAVGAITGPMKDMLDMMGALYTAGRGRLDGVMKHTRPRLLALINWLARLYARIESEAGQAMSAARTVGEIVSPVKDMLDMMGALYSANRGRLDGILAWTRGRLVALFDWLARLWPSIREQAAAAAAASSAIGEIVSPVKDMLDMMGALYSAGRGRLDGILKHTRPRLLALFDWLARLWPAVRDASPAAAAAASAIQALAEPIQAMLDMMAALYTAGRGRLDGILKHLRPRLVALFNWLARLWGDVQTASAPAQAMAAAIAGVADGVQAMIELINDLAAMRRVADIDARMGAIQDAMRSVYDKLAALATDARIQGVERVRKFADAIGVVFSALGDVIAFMRDSVSIVAPKSATFWDRFFEAIQTVMDKLDEWAKGPFRDMATEAVRSLAQLMADVFGGLRDAVEVFRALAFYAGVPREALAAFLDDVAYAMREFSDRAHGELSEAADAVVSAVAGVLSDLFDGLRSAIDLFQSLADESVQRFLAGHSRFGSAFQRAVANLIEAVDKTVIAIRDYVANDLDVEGLGAAQAFAQRMGEIFDNLKKGLDLFSDLASAKLPSVAQLQAFIDAVLALFDALVDRLSDASSDIADSGQAAAAAMRQAAAHAGEVAADAWRGLGAAMAQAFRQGLDMELTAADVTALARGELVIRRAFDLDIHARVEGDLSPAAEAELVDRIVAEIIAELNTGG